MSQLTITDKTDMGKLGIDQLTTYATEQWQQARQFAHKTALAVYRLGGALSHIKAKLPHGEWTPWQKAQGIPPTTASDAIRLYKAVNSKGGESQLEGKGLTEARRIFGLSTPASKKVTSTVVATGTPSQTSTESKASGTQTQTTGKPADKPTETRQEANSGGKADETARKPNASQASPQTPPQQPQDADEEENEEEETEEETRQRELAAMPRAAREMMENEQREDARRVAEQEQAHEQQQKPEHWLGVALDALSNVKTAKGSTVAMRALLTDIRKRVDELDAELHAFAVGFTDATATTPATQNQTH